MTDKEKKEYYVGDVVRELPDGTRILTEVVARPDGTAMIDKQVQVEMLNKLDQIYSLVKNSL